MATILTLEEAARRLSVNPRTIRRYIAEGRLTGFRVGPRFLRVDAAEVDGLLERLPTASAS